MTSSHPHIGNVLMLPGYGAQAASYQQQILSTAQSKLIQYLPLSEISGTTATDVSPRDHDATMVTPKFLERYFSDLSPALRFNGSATYVNLYSAGLATDFDGDEGTIFLVLRIYNPAIFETSEKTVISLNAGNANNAITISIRKAVDNQITFTRVAGGNSKEVAVSAITSLYWMPIAITWSVSNDRLRAYIGGVQQGSDVTGLDAFVGSLAAAGANLGAESTTGTRSKFLTGAVAHCAIWKRELSAAQIASIAVLPAYTTESMLIYKDTYEVDQSSPMTNPQVGPELGSHPESALIDGSKVLVNSPANYLSQTDGSLINNTSGNDGVRYNMNNGVGGQHGPRRRNGLAFYFKGWWESARAELNIQTDNNTGGYSPFTVDMGVAAGGTYSVNDTGAGTGGSYGVMDISLQTVYDMLYVVFDEGHMMLKRGPDEKWRPAWIHWLGKVAFDGTGGTIGLAVNITALSASGGLDRFRLVEHGAVQLPYPLDGGFWTVVSFHETAFPLSTQKETAKDALLFFEFTPPPSPVNGDKIGIRYRMGEGGDANNCYEAYVEFNGATWATKIDEISGGVRTPKGSNGTDASVNSIMVRVIADAHQVFRRVGTVISPAPNGDTSRSHNLTALVQHLDNVECEAFYAAGTTPARFAAIPAENAAWEVIAEPVFGR